MTGRSRPDFTDDYEVTTATPTRRGWWLRDRIAMRRSRREGRSQLHGKWAFAGLADYVTDFHSARIGRSLTFEGQAARKHAYFDPLGSMRRAVGSRPLSAPTADFATPSRWHPGHHHRRRRVGYDCSPRSAAPRAGQGAFRQWTDRMLEPAPDRIGTTLRNAQRTPTLGTVTMGTWHGNFSAGHGSP